MAFTQRTLNESAARKVVSMARRALELIGTARDAIRETHAEFWSGEVSPEDLITEMGTDAAEALGTHWATVQWVAAITGLQNPQDPEAANAVIAAHAPLRTLTPQPDGTVTIAPPA